MGQYRHIWDKKSTPHLGKSCHKSFDLCYFELSPSAYRKNNGTKNQKIAIFGGTKK